MGPIWGPSGADRTQVGPMLAPRTLLSGLTHRQMPYQNSWVFAGDIFTCMLWKCFLTNMSVFSLKFYWSLFLMFQLMMSELWFRWMISTIRQKAITWSNANKDPCGHVMSRGHNGFNLLWPSDTIWRHRSGSTLAQLMACYLTAPSHYLKQCWLTMEGVAFIQEQFHQWPLLLAWFNFNPSMDK